MGWSRRSLVASLSAAIAVLSWAPASLANLSRPLSDYTITTWSRRDGIAAPIWSISQDKDGYLWIGTGSGLTRFDGHRFVSWESLGHGILPANAILALLSARDGSLWIAAGEAGIGRLQNGAFTFYRDADLAFTRTLVEDRHGSVWAGSRGGLYRFDGTRWASQRESVGLPVSPNNGIYEDPAGTMWVLTLQGVYRRDASQPTFQRVAHLPSLPGRSRTQLQALARAAHGRAGPRFGVLQDSRGDVWIPSLGQGLTRVRSMQGVPAIEQLTTDTGLSSNVIGALYEDHESNIWVGTQAGLHELTPRKVTPLDDVGAVSAVHTTADGSTWFASDKGLLRIAKDRRETYTVRHGLPPGIVRAFATDRRGTLWVATDRGLACFANGRFVPLAMRAPQRFGRITAFSIDSSSTVWLSDYQLGVMRLQDGVLAPIDTIAQLDHRRPVTVYVDRADRVWLGFGNGQLGLLESDGRVSMHDVGVKSALGVISDDPDGVVWIGGEDGIARVTNGKAVAVTSSANGFPGSHVTAVIDDGLGSVWAGTSVGIVRVLRTEFDAVAASPSHRIRYMIYDETDGLPGMPTHLGEPAAARGADGRLWFATDGGATVVNPASLPPASRAPQVRVEEVRAGADRFDPAVPFHLAPRPARVEIEYTALTFSSPMSVQFRYRLSGFDADWQDAGTRRQASYTNLPPGQYRFQVVALDKQGSFDPSGAVMTFSIAPALYQTSWFAVGVTAAILALGTGAWLVRVRQIRERFSLVLAERARISREVHDTLLQSLVGVALRSGIVARRLPLSDPTGAREELGRMRKEVEEQIREVRDTILNLRSPTLRQRGLAGAIQDAGERVEHQTSATFTFRVVGRSQPCAQVVEEQLLRIGQEALFNAARHSGASEIRAELRYDAGTVTLGVVDNGIGFDFDATGREDDRHFGLIHMRERAAQAGGHLDVISAKGTGTQVIASFPIASRGAA